MEPVEPRSQRDSNWQPLDDLMGRSLELHVSAVPLTHTDIHPFGRYILLGRCLPIRYPTDPLSASSLIARDTPGSGRHCP